jgi:hypothetical protein
VGSCLVEGALLEEGVSLVGTSSSRAFADLIGGGLNFGTAFRQRFACKGFKQPREDKGRISSVEEATKEGGCTYLGSFFLEPSSKA